MNFVHNLSVFATLVTTYTEAIRNGAIPCVENALKSLALIENTRAVEEAFLFYQHEMETLQLPTKDDKTLNDHHFSCLQNAIKLFLSKAIMDENNQFQGKLNVRRMLASGTGSGISHFRLPDLRGPGGVNHVYRR